jgi:hypothetical protein
VKDRCRCTDCTAANTAASRTASRERSYGRWQPFVDARPVGDHIAALRAAGIGVERIASLAGISVSHIRELAEGGPTESTVTGRVRPRTAARILRIGIDDANRAAHSRVDATGTRRRLQALIAIGWAPELLADQLGRRPNSLTRSMPSASITARTAQDVAVLYERLSNAPPPRVNGEQRAAADAVRTRAAAQAWQPPLAWDDIDTDPTPEPTAGTPPPDDVDEIAIERALAGDGVGYDNLTSAEQQLVIRHLTERGRSIRDTATQPATTKRTVSRRRASVEVVGPGR